jgi:phosphoglycerate kinase
MMQASPRRRRVAVQGGNVGKIGIGDLDLAGKRVLVRVDFNVPMDDQQNIADDRRIRASLPTIKKILAGGGSAILMSHLGRPNGRPDARYGLRPVADRLTAYLDAPIKFAKDCIGPTAHAIVDSLRPGDVLLLENLRFHAEEEANDPEFARALASFGDLYVNDAFGTAHRAHASTVGVTRHLGRCAAGLLMERELKYLGEALEQPVRPFLGILGGAKIKGKIEVIESLFNKVDMLLVGGGMTYTFFRALGFEVGKSLVDEEMIETASRLIRDAKARGFPLVLPQDTQVTTAIDNQAPVKEVLVTDIPEGWIGVDIGSKTMADYAARIASARTVLWNGPMGIFELPAFRRGTEAVARALVRATERGAITVVGGGDSAAAIEQLNLVEKVSHVSTGGGASLEFLEGKVLPGVAALTDA